MADDTRLNAGTGGDLIATDELTTLNGAAATAGLKVQRFKIGFGTDNVLRDVDAANGLPVTGTFFQATQPVSAASLPLPTGAATETSLAGVRTDLGTDGTTPPSVLGAGTGVRGWLRSIYEKLTGTLAVTGTFFQATQPVSIAATVAVNGPATDAQLRATPLPVSGTVSTGGLTDTQLRATPVPISGSVTTGGLTDTQLRASAVPVTLSAETTKVIGTVNLSAAQTLFTVTTVAAVTAITNALPTGANTIGAVTGPAAAPLALDATLTNHTQRFQAVTTLTTLSAANTTVTLTLPAVAAQFHYISRIEIVRVATAAVAGSAVLTYTSTNIPGSWARSAGNAIAAGGTVKDVDEVLENPIKSSVVNTATTIVAPVAGAACQVRITAYYYTAA